MLRILKETPPGGLERIAGAICYSLPDRQEQPGRFAQWLLRTNTEPTLKLANPDAVVTCLDQPDIFLCPFLRLDGQTYYCHNRYMFEDTQADGKFTKSPLAACLHPDVVARRVISE